MNGIMTLARKEVKTAFRDYIFLIVTGLFVLLSVISVYIGSSTKNAELQAYQDIVQLLKSQGATSLPVPPAIYPLSVLSNIVSYVSMIGAVVAIFLGFESFSGERNNGTLKLIAVRPVYRDQIVTGKLLGGGMVIGVLLGIILIFNLVLFVFVSGLTPGINEIIRLLSFFLLAFVYMMVFYTATMYVSIRTNDSAFGFMLMMIIWVTISFLLPQLADSQRSFAYALNATAQTVTQVPSDTVVSKMIELFSPAAQFRSIGKDLLQVIPETSNIGLVELLLKQTGAIIEILMPGLAMLLLSYKAAQKEEVI
ncbi:ABC transporter permease [Dehalobacterium formicoaceticum]|uniref:ABC transporter permease n=1 Tax=Dehalobacterium formicoaceticum TaxID=51515 RepID=A0ABT1Y2Q6_9FIRM|nr:ABC transporter permease subunit [Dehalobacterium formicoaceticum]MCR6545147.1 ABC transporter permease [Dehalobacterium formicoaceticum]